MGYDVHITRRKSWSDESGPAISEQEWLAHARGDADLEALVCSGGNVDAKYPDAALLAKMVAAAAALGATVQGDDGETYDLSGSATPAPQPGVMARIAGWFTNRLSSGAAPLEEAALPFKVGDRVRDAWGNVGRVTAIDLRADHGLGRITVRLEDGRISHSVAAAHGLEAAD